MSKRPWMPLYIGDYLGDTAHLSTAEHGCYLLLIMHYWEHGKLPCGDRALARIARVEPEWWSRSYRAVMQQFFTTEWKHKRIEIELKKVVSLKSLKNFHFHHGEKRKWKRKFPNDINDPISHTHIHKEKKERKQASTARARARVCDCAPLDAVEFGLKKNWERSRIAEEWQRFRDYHLAHGKQPKNIMAAWRNWCRSPFRNSNGHSSQQTPRPGSREDRKEKVQHALQQLDDYNNLPNDEGPSNQTDQTNARVIPIRRPR